MVHERWSRINPVLPRFIDLGTCTSFICGTLTFQYVVNHAQAPLKRNNQKIFTSHIINFATGFTFVHFTRKRRYMHYTSTHTSSFLLTTLSATLTKCVICGTDNLWTTLLSLRLSSLYALLCLETIRIDMIRGLTQAP